MQFMARDITERLKLENLERHSQRLDSLGTLAGGISHDLNNALTPITMSIETLRNTYPEESSLLDNLEISSRHCADMVRQLLTFANGSANERTPVSPSRLLKDIGQLAKSTFPKNVRLLIRTNTETAYIMGDATQLHQVLLNLCVNARDAMPHGGTITLTSECQDVEMATAKEILNSEPGEYLTLQVSDTGTGIPAEALDHIFDPFFSTKDPSKGTGLGLSIVQGIIKSHDGFVKVESKSGQGTTFTIYLPTIKNNHDIGDTANDKKEFQGNNETILFVDDEALLRETAFKIFKRMNLNPLIATDGTDALVQAMQHQNELHLIITDMNMPQMDGLGFVRAVRRILPDIPIVVASGRLEETHIAEFKSLNVTKRLDKPFTESQLKNILAEIFALKET